MGDVTRDEELFPLWAASRDDDDDDDDDDFEEREEEGEEKGTGLVWSSRHRPVHSIAATCTAAGSIALPGIMATWAPLGLLKDIPCPEGDKYKSSQTNPPPQVTLPTTSSTQLQQDVHAGGPSDRQSAKRRRLSTSTGSSKRAKLAATALQAPIQGGDTDVKARLSSSATPTVPVSSQSPTCRPQLRTLASTIPAPERPALQPRRADKRVARPVTCTSSFKQPPSAPPVAQPVNTGQPSQSSTPIIPTVTRRQVKKEALNPRHILQPPAAHATRFTILKKLHSIMEAKNTDMTNKFKDAPDKQPLLLQSHELIGMALDEEEKVAKESKTLYNNVVRLRIVKLMKMSLDDWESEVMRFLQLDVPGGAAGTTSSQSVATPSTQPALGSGAGARHVSRISSEPSTGLEPLEERQLLYKFYAKPEELAKRGAFVLTRPSAESVTEAENTAALAQNWEKCERCGSRFQVFPGRRASDGVLATNGPCTYHPSSRPYVPRASGFTGRFDHITGPREPIYGCCGEAVGASAGCTRCEYHVWKTTSPARLATVLQFEHTPEPAETIDLDSDSAGSLGEADSQYLPLTFDCEMSYTTLGLELTRLTAVTWPDNAPVIDILVRPYGEMLDFNTRYSGVTAELFARAYPLGTEPSSPQDDPSEVPRLPIASDPAAARALLFRHLKPTTPLIGHAIDNDLNAVRIIHPTIIDTSLLYPHPRSGSGLQFSLRVLAQKHLNRRIQQGGGVQGHVGHDSLEDAVATGDLVRVKVRDMWLRLKHMGWRVEGGRLVSPRGRELGQGIGGKRASEESSPQPLVRRPNF
ncbi:RNA exonuclease 3 [Ascosphaera acerosa]|nr:RNA exonuclease 3 [Ascosphaera acerosa]